MSKKDNFSQAAYEMFGIGRGGSKREADKTAEKPAESAAMDVEEDEMSLTVAPTVAEVKPLEKVPEKPKTTLLAEGSVFEGTLHTKGDVEIAGVFKGENGTGQITITASSGTPPPTTPRPSTPPPTTVITTTTR